MRGGEKVLLELVRLFPSADVFTLVWNRGTVSTEIEARVKGTSFLGRLPGIASAYRYYLPLFPAAIRSLDLSVYDLILSSSHAVAKGVRVRPGQVHVSYVHTPMRYLWETRADYFRFGRGRWWKRAALAAVRPALRRFDRSSSNGVDYFLANSENVRQRIRLAYGAEAQVVYPPADTSFFTPYRGSCAESGYYLVVSSLEPYKRIDLAVQAFGGGSRRLLIAGKGTLDAQLRAQAHRLSGSRIEFLGEVTDERLGELYRHCRALIFPGLEDFGLTAVEAQACGRPVVCYGAGGALETVIDGVTGVHFAAQTPRALISAVERLERAEWDRDRIRRHSLQFSRERFHEEMKNFLYGAGLHTAA